MANPTSFGPAVRRSNYRAAEDVAITRAYINISTDPIVGAEQKKGTYYNCIYESFKKKKPVDVPVRRINSVKTRFKAILKDCTKFSACFATGKAIQRSSTSEDDEIRLAAALFNKKEVDHPRKDIDPKFKFIQCWEILKYFPKFFYAEHTST